MNTITYNPFVHMSNGVKKLLQTNFWQIVVLYIVTTILIVIGIVAVFALTINAFVDGDRPGVISVVLGITLFIAVLLVSSFLTLAMNRLILDGVRGKRLSASEAFKFGLSRFGLYAALVLAAVGLFVLAGLLTAFLPLIGIIVMLALIVVLVLYLPALICLSFVIVEDSKPAGIKEAARTSIATAKNATGQIWTFIGVLILLSFIISAITGSNSAPTDTITAEAFVGSGLRGVIGTILNLAFGAVTAFGLAELYAKAAKSKSSTKAKATE